jgi:hypothetical protein
MHGFEENGRAQHWAFREDYVSQLPGKQQGTGSLK